MLRGKIFGNGIKSANLSSKEEELRIKLLVEPNNKLLLKELALMTYYLKDYSSSKKIFKKLVELDPKNKENFAFLGYLYYELEDYTKAIKNYLLYLEEEKDPFVFFLLGNAYSRIGKIIEAIEAYEEVIYLNEDMYLLHLAFAKNYEEKEKDKKALCEYKAAYEIDPRDKKILEKIEYLQTKMKELESKLLV